MAPVASPIHSVPVAAIRPEDGLGRRRDREGHRELCRSIEMFGVLTPVTVRVAPDGSGDYLLVKGQGRTLACPFWASKRSPPSSLITLMRTRKRSSSSWWKMSLD